MKKSDMPGAAPKEQGKWCYCLGEERPDWHPYHSQSWWIDEFQSGWEQEKRNKEQREAYKKFLFEV